MTAINMITEDVLKSRLNYDKDTGIFTFIKSAGSRKKGDIAGSLNVNGYINIKINKKFYKAHRLAWLYVYGEMPNGDIDHLNHIRTDNRIENLRVVDKHTNMKNQKRNTKNKSGVAGVYWHNKQKLWHSYITLSYKRIHLGSFTEFSEAVKARKNAELKYGFHKNHGKREVA